MTPDTPRRGWKGLSVWMRALVLLGVAGPALTWFGHSRWKEGEIAQNERAVSAAIKTLTSAEADFRGNDRDANRIQDFWTGDVAGLQVTLVNGRPLDLIEAAIAAADTLPTHPGSRRRSPTTAITSG